MSLLTLTVPAQRTPTDRLVPGAPVDVSAQTRAGVDVSPVMPAARLSRPGTLVTYVVAAPYAHAA
jgi:hypothetical protein